MFLVNTPVFMADTGIMMNSEPAITQIMTKNLVKNSGYGVYPGRE